MPPKVPNLKFKPKLVVQRKDEDESDATLEASSAAPSLTDSTSLQQERLRRLEAMQSDAHRDPGAGMSDYSRIRASDAAASASAPATSTTPGASHAPRRTGASSSSGGGGSGGGSGGGGGERSAAASGSPRTSHLSAQARLNRAMMQNVDRSQFAPAARPLPVNTMERYFCGDSAQEEGTGHSRHYRPIPLQPTATSSFTGAAAATAESAAPVATDGTAFLREAQAETSQSYAANGRFRDEMLAPLLEGSTAAAPSAPPLVWAQMPRFSLDAPFDLQHLQASGKVGELKVYKSGRMVMTIGAVSYDVAIDHEGHDGCASSATMAAVTQPPAYPSDPSSLASCYMLGQLRHKMICTPSLDQL